MLGRRRVPHYFALGGVSAGASGSWGLVAALAYLVMRARVPTRGGGTGLATA